MELDRKIFMHEIFIPYESVGNDHPKWNEICAMIVERFGLPGGRFHSVPSNEWMAFYFKDKKDALMCRMMLSEYVKTRERWILTVSDDYTITLPDDFLERTGWKEGDVIEWLDNQDGSWTLKKKSV